MTAQRKVLIVRSARDTALGYAARVVRERHPDAQVAVLCQAQHTARATAAAQADAVYEYPAATFAPAGISEELFDRLQQAAFDEVVILYHNANGDGYAPVHAMVHDFHRGSVTVVDSTGRYYWHSNGLLTRKKAGVMVLAAALGGVAAAAAYLLLHRRKP